MNHPEPLHPLWCDRRHVEVGSPVCSAVVGRVQEISVMLYANGEDGTDVAITGADGASLLAWPAHLMLQLVRRLDEATQIALGTWPPLLDDAGETYGDPWVRRGRPIVDEAERAIRTILKRPDDDVRAVGS
jgi:hypothetical protein